MEAVVAEPFSEILPWLKTLPLAPEYHPTLAEFQDPISYIFKIEKEASKFGICKIVPPLPPQPKKTTFGNLNRSLAARNPNPNSKSPPTFTTRQQQIGFCPRKPRPVQKPVWQSGERYNIQQFEVKAKNFEKTQLKKCGKKGLSALEIETLFWKASVDRPFSVEYANDMPGSAFATANGKKWREAAEAATIGETAWNMRGVSRAKGSLLRFMKEEIPGVTSPMAYLAMMFSWFAWHVEDHDLHSLNYLHLGAGKTWYGVPREAAVAFEEVVRVHGYGGEFNPLVTFAILGEKTTVMSPEVLIGAGIPCCRLVQNAGEFVVTFPRAYHSGFSHGFNCGEAANIATPEWLTVAKESAIRRASINYPPMVSHFQLLYALALTLCSRIPMSIGIEPRSSRLKDKKRGEGETMVKDLFVLNVIQNNDLLHVLLEEGSSCVLLPEKSSGFSEYSNLRVGSKLKVKPRLPLVLCSPEEALEDSEVLLNDVMLDRDTQLRHFSGFRSIKEKSSSMCEGRRFSLSSMRYSQCGNADPCISTSDKHCTDSEKESISQGDGLLDRGLFSCVTCGILSFACAAVIQPREAAARYLMSADCSFFNDWMVGSGVTSNRYIGANGKANASEPNPFPGRMEKSEQDDLYDVPVQAGSYPVQVSDRRVEVVSDTEVEKAITSLDLLAFTYGDSSDSDKEQVCSDENDMSDCSLQSNLNDQSRSAIGVSSKSKFLCDDSRLSSLDPYCRDGAVSSFSFPLSRPSSGNEVTVQISDCTGASDSIYGHFSANCKDRSQEIFVSTLESDTGNLMSMKSNSLEGKYRDATMMSRRVITGSAEVPESDVMMERIENGYADHSRSSNSSHGISCCSSAAHFVESTKCSNIDVSVKDTTISLMQRSDEGSSRMHIFCLEHAVEVEKQLRPIGGVHMLLLCNPDYPKVEVEAKSLAEELGINYFWNHTPFREATKEDLERVQAALDDEEAIHGNEDWAVKLGINLYYSASLSRSPLYSKQMPYNSVIYNAFGRSSAANSPTKPEVSRKGTGKQKKIVVAGKWCGKVWMSNQVHPYLAQRDSQEQGHSRSFHTRATPDVEFEEKLDVDSQTEREGLSTRNSLGVGTPIARKPDRKRKKGFKKGIVKKPKFPHMNNPIKVVDGSPDTTSQCGRILRSAQVKHETLPLHNDTDTEKYIACRGSNVKEKSEGGPSTRLRKRLSKPPDEVKVKSVGEKQAKKKNAKKATGSNKDARMKDEEAEYQCDMDGCTMGFSTKQELLLHKRNICSVKGCLKKFFSHKYLVQHRRVHIDDRPLKCPWKGCKMTFKWAWARTEHIRVHTGARPYVCREAGCGQTFRFVSDFSRHKRKTGHSAKKGRG